MGCACLQYENSKLLILGGNNTNLAKSNFVFSINLLDGQIDFYRQIQEFITFYKIFVEDESLYIFDCSEIFPKVILYKLL